MIRMLSSTPLDASIVGSKAAGLMELRQKSFPIPAGIVLDTDTFRSELALHGSLSEIESLLSKLKQENVAETSGQIKERLLDFHLSDTLLNEIGQALKPDRTYAVRSSSAMEDLADASFAGLYESYLRRQGTDKIASAVADCYRSLFSERSLSYLCKKKGAFDPKKLTMAVVIQEMVPATVAGVLFTAHPVDGLDRVMVAELTDGTAEDLVAGKTSAHSIRLPWFGQLDSETGVLGLSVKNLEQLRGLGLRVARYYGYPCDIEIAMDPACEWKLLQARPITSFRYAGISNQWTTADFKDGGVSSTVCHPYMWSMYEYSFTNALKRFLDEGKLIVPPPSTNYIRMFFGRPYWNLDIVKSAMAKVPGYKERSFDADYGISGNYSDDGTVTPVNPKTILAFLPVAIQQTKLLREREKAFVELKEDLLKELDRANIEVDLLETAPDRKDIAELWLDIHERLYLHCECSYFHQIFLNTIHQTRIRDSLLKHMDWDTYLTLLGGLEEVSHLLPFYDLWDMSRKIRTGAEDLEIWQNESDEAIQQRLADGLSNPLSIHLLEQWIDRYGYHSQKEIDVSWPSYREDVPAIIRQIKEMLGWPDELGPESDLSAARAAVDQAVDGLRAKYGKRKAGKLEDKIVRIRSLLWWREEFRDISTRCYDLIRRIALLLGEQLVQEGTLSDKSDIWFLEFGQLSSFLSGETDAAQLHEWLEEQTLYYEAYRNYCSDNEIPSTISGQRAAQADQAAEGTSTAAADGRHERLMQGLAAGGGQVSGRTRVIGSLAEIDQIQPGDILVTRFTDTGWTAKFAMLAGIVTEYGGILCHAAIVSREYGIPCVVGVNRLMEHVIDGQTITIDGNSGQVRLSDNMWQEKTTNG